MKNETRENEIERRISEVERMKPGEKEWKHKGESKTSSEYKRETKTRNKIKERRKQIKRKEIK